MAWRLAVIAAWTLIVVGALYVMYRTEHDCEARGGVLVKGAFTYSCIYAVPAK